MRIAYHIRELLLDGKDVTVAGLGTFECRRLTALYEKERKLFLPPQLEVEFKYNEFCVGESFNFYVTEKESVKPDDARRLIEDAVEEINYQVDKGKRYKYPGLGTFSRDEYRKIIFEPSQDLLSGGEYFGLTPVPVAASFRSKRSRGMTFFLILMLIVGAVLVGYWGYMVWNMVESQHKPLTAPAVQPATEAPKVTVSPGQRALDSIRQLQTSAPARVEPEVSPVTQRAAEVPDKVSPAKPPKENPPPSEAKPAENSGEPRFYVVAGCFRSDEGARKFVQQLKAKGYKSEIFAKSESGLNMVSYASYPTRAEADAGLRKIREAENKAAYIFSH